MKPTRHVLAVVLLSSMSHPVLAQEEVQDDSETEGGANEPKQPKRGDFDAGGNVRLPNGPDETGEFATFNWIAADLKGRYYLLDWISVHGTIPLAVKKPDSFAMSGDPRLIGGMVATFDVRLPEMPFAPKKYKTDIALTLSGAYMREGAMLLSDKDFPLFVGDFQPGFTSGMAINLRMSSLVDFALAPLYVYQAGEMESLTAVQIPTSLVLKLGSLVKLSADAGVYTGDDFSFSGDDGGRIALGAALDVKIGPIIVHAGSGFASLLTGGFYPTIGDSLYIDLNVKFAK